MSEIPRKRPRPPARWGAAIPLALLVALLVVVGLPTGAFANGGTLRLANVPMGEYRVSVFTDPTPVRPDSLDVSVLVITPTGEVPTDAGEVEVRVTAEPVDPLEVEGPPGDKDAPAARTVPATREQADDPRYYAAKFILGAEGRWRIRVALRGERGSGEAAFEVTARKRGLLGHPAVLILLALLPLAGAAWWVLKTDPEGDAGALTSS